MVKNLVFSGGGIKCISYIGILKYLEENNMIKDIQSIAGSSGGAIFAFILILGYTYHELYLLINGLNFEEIKDVTSDNLFQFFNNFGIDTGNKLIKLLKLLINKKYGNNSENITFLELFDRTKINLTITGTCLDTNSIEYFNHKSTPDMKLISALRISFSIPIVYNKVDLNGKIYVDGGLIDNLPIGIFHNDIKNTVGFYLNTNINNNINIHTIDNYMLSILLTLSKKIDLNVLEKYKDYIIIIEVDISSIDFKINSHQKISTIEKGYQYAKKYFENKKLSKIFIKEEKKKITEDQILITHIYEKIDINRINLNSISLNRTKKNIVSNNDIIDNISIINNIKNSFLQI